MWKKGIVWVLACALVLGAVMPNMTASAAGKVRLSATKVTIAVGKDKTLHLKNAMKKVTWTVISGKKNVTVKSRKKTSAVLQGKKSGKAKVQAKCGRKKYICHITVKKAPHNKKDVANLKKLIAKVSKKSKPSKNLNNFNSKSMYEWDDRGRLVMLEWKKCNLKGSLSFADLPELKTINLYSNQITGVDVTKNVKLESLYFPENKVKKIDVTKCPKLVYLGCSDNRISKLDLSKNAVLKNLSCGNNALTTLELTSKKLHSLDCEGNPLRQLDLSQNSRLTQLTVGNPELKTLDLSKNKELTILDISRLENGDLAEIGLDSLDLSQNTKLLELRISNTHLTKLDLRANKLLHDAELWSNAYLKTVDIRGLAKIQWFRIIKSPHIEKFYLTKALHDKQGITIDWTWDNNPALEVIWE